MIFITIFPQNNRHGAGSQKMHLNELKFLIHLVYFCQLERAIPKKNMIPFLLHCQEVWILVLFSLQYLISDQGL